MDPPSIHGSFALIIDFIRVGKGLGWGLLRFEVVLPNLWKLSMLSLLAKSSKGESTFPFILVSRGRGIWLRKYRFGFQKHRFLLPRKLYIIGVWDLENGRTIFGKTSQISKVIARSTQRSPFEMYYNSPSRVFGKFSFSFHNT